MHMKLHGRISFNHITGIKTGWVTKKQRIEWRTVLTLIVYEQQERRRAQHRAGTLLEWHAYFH